MDDRDMNGRGTDGELEPAGERWRLRFSRELAHPPAKVWTAITQPEHLEAWFPQRIVGPWEVGARLRFEAEGGSFEGEVLRVEPGRLLEFTWGTDMITLEVVPNGPGSILTLLDTFDELGKAARDGAGWHTCLDFLEHDLAAAPAPWDTRQRWEAVHPGYVVKFGPEAASVGPPG